MTKEPKIEIKCFWNAAFSIPYNPVDGNNAADVLASGHPIILCEIVIDGKAKGKVFYDGKKVFMEKKPRKKRRRQ